jgi:hypothetical protein
VRELGHELALSGKSQELLGRIHGRNLPVLCVSYLTHRTQTPAEGSAQSSNSKTVFLISTNTDAGKKTLMFKR